MGLDILAISRINFDSINEEAELDTESRDEETDQNFIFLMNNDILFEQSDGIKQGNYRYDGACDSFGAGSYSGYNRWREKLAFLAGWDISDLHEAAIKTLARNENLNEVLDQDDTAKVEIPFVELIMFSDCEGFIGTKTSAKLFKDFSEHLEDAKEIGDGFFYLYEHFMNAFDLASDDGCVVFC